MSNVAVSRRNQATKRGNKENAQPQHGKAVVNRDFLGLSKPAVPFKVKSNEKEETVANVCSLKAAGKREDARSAGLKNRKGAAGDVKQQALSQTSLPGQTSKHKKTVTEGSGPASAALPSKPAPGMYKGRVVQSKIGSIWKSGAPAGAVLTKPPAAKTASQKAGNLMKTRSKSVADIPGRGPQKPAIARSKSVVDGHEQASRPPVTTSFRSARPPVKAYPAAKTSRNPTAAPAQRGEAERSRPKAPVTDVKASKAPVSTLSQYRTTETLEERRAKLAEWLASKGKTLKRPAMTVAPPPKTKTSAKPREHLRAQTQQVEPEPEPESAPEPEPVPEPEPSVQADQPGPAAPACAEGIMDTSLDLLDDTDENLQGGVEDVVLNLCEALEAMEVPFDCKEEETSPLTAEHNVEEKDEVKEEGMGGRDDVEDLESDEDEYEEDVDSESQMDNASVVKYSVKTTPYLQSVKRTIEDEASRSSSRRKSNIKDLKFLTPVRRSARIQRNSSRMPSMLADHDTCVSSLAELVHLDDDPNAYIYRKNPALLEDLPDLPRL